MPPPPPMGGYYRRPFVGRGHRPYFRSGGCGCLAAPIALILVLMVAVVMMFGSCGSCYQGNYGSSNTVTASTKERETLPSGSVNETGYYTDELGWVGNSTTLTAGMKNFYQETGVQPYLYLTDTINGSHNPTDADFDAFANSLYDELFTDEAHLLFIFFEYNSSGDYHMWYVAGSQAKTVLDDEAMNILMDCVEKYYYDSSLTDEQVFSKAFDEAGGRIMEVTTSPWIPVLIIVGVLLIFLVIFLWWRSYKKQKNLEAEQTQQILETPLETFGNTQADDLAKKYENNDNQ